MPISTGFPDLEFNGTQIEFGHLVPIRHELVGHGRDKASIHVRVSFQSHVFSQTAGSREPLPFLDENGKARAFCPDRYKLSLDLPNFCVDVLSNNMLTWISKDRDSVSNMAVVKTPLVSGEHYAIYYYLFPSRLDDCDVELVVKSAYKRNIDFSKIKRRHKALQKIKECYYQQKVVP